MRTGLQVTDLALKLLGAAIGAVLAYLAAKQFLPSSRVATGVSPAAASLISLTISSVRDVSSTAFGIIRVQHDLRAIRAMFNWTLTQLRASTRPQAPIPYDALDAALSLECVQERLRSIHGAQARECLRAELVKARVHAKSYADLTPSDATALNEATSAMIRALEGKSP
jgi:hypothetical protein